jgi:hypothetical protein
MIWYVKQVDSRLAMQLFDIYLLNKKTQGGGWCSTLKDCSNRRMMALGSSNYMKPIQFAGAGILDSGQQLNPGNC